MPLQHATSAAPYRSNVSAFDRWNARPRIRHHGWLVEQSVEGFEATHPDYCNPLDDDRVVFAETLEDLAFEIEQWIEEHGA